MTVGLRQPYVIIKELYEHVGLLSSICYQKQFKFPQNRVIYLRKGGVFASIVIKYMIYAKVKHILNIRRQHDQTQRGKAQKRLQLP